jgi:crotonobetainyl-CoA:carnitine CoA-transferase CaiB-like acyl-CoA transferase
MSITIEAVSLLPSYHVLDLSSSMGSFCGKVLRDLGMEVIKIEPPGGDAGRLEPPFAKGHAHREGSLRFAYLKRQEQHHADITKERAKDFSRLVARPMSCRNLGAGVMGASRL